MPSQTRRNSKKPQMPGHRLVRSASSDTLESHQTRSPKRLHNFWRRKRTVTPTAIRAFASEGQQEQSDGGKSPAVPSCVEDDPNDSIIFLNNPTEFDLRSFFFRRPKSALSSGHLERSAISYGSSTSSHRSNTRGFTSTDTSNKGTFSRGTKPEAMDSSLEAVATKPTGKPRRRLRAKEELCMVLPRSTSRGRTRSQKSWFLGPGFVGRDPGEGTLVVTKDKSMDPVHAEVSVAGDNYFVRDVGSTTGTFLCLSTRFRHYPQRDGFRLRHGDVFRIGPTTSIRVVELQTTTATQVFRRTRSDKSNPSSNSTSASKQDHSASTADTSKGQPSKLERTPSTSSSGNGHDHLTLKRISTVEERRLLAADIEDEFINEAGRIHSRRIGVRDSAKTESSQENKRPRSKTHHTVHFSDTPPVMSDGTVFFGSRYIRPEVKQLHYHEPSQAEDVDDDMIDKLVGSESESKKPYRNLFPVTTRRPALVRLAIFQHDPAKASSEPLKVRDAREVTLPGQDTYLIGSSSACDVRIFPSEGIEVRAMHARIMFDGASFVLQDISFERDPRRQTRVLLTQRFTKVTRGDWLLLGKCALYVTTVARAFGCERRPDMKEAAMRIDVLRLSKRKPRTRGVFVPVGFRLLSSSGSGASSGSGGWGGSSGGPVTFGKGRDCDAQVFTASLATEQFSVQLERGTCLLTPKPTGINTGTYFLIGRDEARPLVIPSTRAVEEDTGEDEMVEVVKHTSKPLLLSEGCVFRCGGCELEVIYSKSAADVKSAAAREEQEHVRLLSAMPWLQQIASDWKTITNLARCGQRLLLGSGEMVYEKGDPANFVFMIISGEVALQLSKSDDDLDRGDSPQILVEHVATGGFFGEVSLHDPSDSIDDLEYADSAKVSSACVLLALAREDVCGYLELYMDIVRAHLRHNRCRDRTIRAACSSVPWLRGLSLQEMRMLSADAEVAVYGNGSTLFEDGKLFVPAAFAGGSTLQLRDGLLVLSRGKVRIIRSKRERERRRTIKVYEEDYEEEQHDPNSVQDVEEEADSETDEWWRSIDPVLAMSSTSSPSVLNFCDLSFRLEACSTVECFFVAAAHLAHLALGTPRQQSGNGPGSPTAAQHQAPLKRGNSLLGRRMHHSQVVTSALHGGDSTSGDDDDHNSLDGSDGEGDTTGARRWRRKKRNKHLLEQTVLETQNDAQIPNALVLYVLGGAQRGDIHVVRNVASIGGILSGADIELNDRYVSRAHAIIEYHDSRYWLYDNGSKWGTFVRLEEDNAVDINPGDIFLAGEVEFTCLASYPERNKPSMCCIM
ncbi:hypothetical protein ON010_g1195 [Phytophthora cinnamomi]|nr:hypothetical protein ON010_g1195 [Phytophthora cinnamomi]